VPSPKAATPFDAGCSTPQLIGDAGKEDGRESEKPSNPPVVAAEGSSIETLSANATNQSFSNLILIVPRLGK